MKIVKLYCAEFNKCMIILTNYSKKFDSIFNLVDIVKKDFSNVENKEIEVVILGGKKYKGMYAVEFNPKKENVPESYDRVKEFEYLA